MTNTIKLKRGSGSDPAASDMVVGEPVLRSDTAELFFKKDDGSVAKVSGGGGGGSSFQYLALRNAANDGAASYPGNDFTLVTSGTTTAVSPATANALILSYGGVVQKPNSGTSTSGITGFIVDGSRLKTATNFAAAPDFIVYQESGGIGEPSDNTVTSAKIADNAVGAEHIEVLDANLQLADSVKIQVGAGNDLEIYHDGNSYVTNTTANQLAVQSNDLKLRSYTDLENYLVATHNGAVELYYNGSKKFETYASGTTTTGHSVIHGNISMGDSYEIKLGNADDLKLYHSSNVSTILDSYGDLRIMGDTIRIQRQAGGENFFYATEGGAVKLYYDGGSKFETISNGVKVNGTIEIYYDGSHSYLKNTSGIQFINSNSIYMRTEDSSEDYFRATQNGSVELYYDGSKKLYTRTDGIEVLGVVSATDHIYLPDSKKLRIGNNPDLEIYHDGSNSYIEDIGTGVLVIASNQINLENAAKTEYLAKLVENGAVELYYDGSKKLDTYTGGVIVHGELHVASHVVMEDNDIIKLGSSADLQIYHDGTYNTLAGANFLVRNAAANETLIYAVENGSAELWYDNSKKLETKNYGIQLSDYLYMDDGKEIRMGNDQDLKIYFDGTDTFFKNHSSGSTYHRARVNWQVGVNATDGGADDAIKALQNGSVELYYDHSMKLQTYAGGVYISGDLTASDGSKIALGSSADLKLHHTSNSSWIENTTGALYIRTAASNGVYILDNNNDTLLSATDDAGIVLCWDNSPKFETTSVGATVTGRLSAWYDATQVAGLYLRNSNDSGTAVQFAKNDGTIVGSISQTASATSFNTSSDYRLKENEVDISDGITRLKTLKPYKFNFKADPSKTVDGFFAHEVTPAVPEAIAGEKDGTEMQQLDQSKLVPLLTAALQEAITKIETLETKVAALEGA